jgi:hypothetical protein
MTHQRGEKMWENHPPSGGIEPHCWVHTNYIIMWLVRYSWCTTWCFRFVL